MQVFLYSPFSFSRAGGVDGPANFIGCNDIICDDICSRYRDTVTLSDDGDICPSPGAGDQVSHGQLSPMSQCSHWSPLRSSPHIPHLGSLTSDASLVIQLPPCTHHLASPGETAIFCAVDLMKFSYILLLSRALSREGSYPEHCTCEM